MKEVFLSLVRLGLWGKAQDIPSVTLSMQEWQHIWNMSQAQTLEGIVLDGILQLPPAQLPNESVISSWKAYVARCENYNKRQQVVAFQLEYLFKHTHQLPFYVIKGQSIAKLYHNPLHRRGGDIDLWFGTPEAQEKANQIIESMGIKTSKYRFDSSYEYQGMEIENHSFLIELNNPLIKTKIRALEQEIFQKGTPDLDPLGNLLLQITHILKHQLGNGIGLRQICDLAVSLEKLEYNQEQFKTYCKQFGIYHWTALLFSVIHTYLDVSLEKFPFLPKGNAEMMMEEILAAGNFGFVDTRFGERNKQGWRKKMQSLQIVWHKTKLFFYYIPSESFWRPYMLFTKGY